jgi:fluoroquinolone transport system permease protein
MKYLLKPLVPGWLNDEVMIRMIRFSLWQIKLLARYQILMVAFVIAGAYTLAFTLIPVLQIDTVLIYLIFSDPTALGFIFIGAMILFEKSDQTLPAQVITPLKPYELLWSKALALLVPTIICSLVMMVAAKGSQFRILLFLVNITLTSLLFTFLGIAGAMRVKTFNQYIIVIPLFIAPTSLPLLNFFGLIHWKVLYLIPTQSSLYLFQQTLRSPDLVGELISIFYLALWVYFSYLFSKRTLLKYLYQ